MGDGNLSQDEIDALLTGGEPSAEGDPTGADPLAGLGLGAETTADPMAGFGGEGEDLLAGLTGGDDGMMMGADGGDDLASLDALAGLTGDAGGGGVDLGFGDTLGMPDAAETTAGDGMSGGGGYFGPKPPNYDLLLNVELLITVELGRVKKYVKDILALGEGSIIELDKTASDPVDLLISNKIIGHGEVVVSDENFGVRITKWNKLV